MKFHGIFKIKIPSADEKEGSKKFVLLLNQLPIENYRILEAQWRNWVSGPSYDGKVEGEIEFENLPLLPTSVSIYSLVIRDLGLKYDKFLLDKIDGAGVDELEISGRAVLITENFALRGPEIIYSISGNPIEIYKFLLPIVKKKEQEEEERRKKEKEREEEKKKQRETEMEAWKKELKNVLIKLKDWEQRIESVLDLPIRIEFYEDFRNIWYEVHFISDDEDDDC